jgi:integrase
LSSSPQELEQPDSQSETEFFLLSLRTKATRKSFKAYLHLVLHGQIDTFLALARADKHKAENQILMWALQNKERLNPEYLKSYIGAVRSLCNFCDIQLNWSRITKVIPKSPRPWDRAILVEEARKAYEPADSRLKFIITLLASSGIRVGAFDFLSVKDLQVKEGYGILTVYRGEPEEYTTFVSSECIHDYTNYLDERKRAGEIIGPDSPLFATRVNFERLRGKPNRSSAQTLKYCLWMAWKKAGLQTGEREFKMAHGFRKFFKTRLENAGMKSIFIETLMGHETGLDAAYYRPTVDELAKEYTKYQNALYITEAQEVKATLEIKERDWKSRFESYEFAKR